MVSEELKKRVSNFIEMERRSCSMDLITPEYVARCLYISVDDAVEALEMLNQEL